MTRNFTRVYAPVPARFSGAEHELAGRVVEALRDGGGAYIFGQVGRGKTHLACAVCKALPRASFMTVNGIMSDIKASYSDGSEFSEQQVIDWYSSCDCLVIDDLGKGDTSQWAMSRLFEIIDSRYAHMKPLVLTSQYKPSELVQRLGDPDTALAIVSRLSGMCKKFELKGEDRRLCA